MRITQKGQVTIVSRLRGTASVRMTTNKILSLTRGNFRIDNSTLLTRDTKRFQHYFTKLKIISP